MATHIRVTREGQIETPFTPEEEQARLEAEAKVIARKERFDAEALRQQELKADAFLTQWEDRLRGKSLLEIKTAFDNATQAQKSELLFALVLRWAMEIK